MNPIDLLLLIKAKRNNGPNLNVQATKVFDAFGPIDTVITPDEGYDAMESVECKVDVKLERHLVATQNGTYPPNTDDGYVGWDEFEVNVQPNLQSKSISITQNGTTTVSPDQNKDGLSSVEVEVNVPSATPSGTKQITITENGTTTEDVAAYANAEITVAITDPNPVAEDNDVIFIDYDGTIRYSYSAADFANLTELPANPDHTDMGLTAQGWNWTLANAKAYVEKYKLLVIGQVYTTTSGATEIDFELLEGRTNPYLCLRINGTVIVDWGDGSATEEISGTNYLSVNIFTQHDYQNAGIYTIKIYPKTSATKWRTGGNNSIGSYLLSFGDTSTNNSIYRCHVYAIRFGDGFYGSDYQSTYAFAFMSGLKYITFPFAQYSLSGGAMLNGCTSITGLVISGSSDPIGQSEMINCQFISRPKEVTDGYGYAYQRSERKMTISDLATTLGTEFMGASIRVFHIPEGITTINQNAFFRCVSLKRLYFHPTTPPTVSNENAFSKIPSDCIIYVPYSADHSILTTYQDATNYGTIASQMQEEPQ